MSVISHLEPKPVFRFFEEICQIPHGSGNTKQISDYCVDFARKRGLEYHQDALNNVIIIKPATPGYEQAPAVIVQGHLDMVAEKDPDCPINMETDGLQLRLDGDRIWAEGTSLGGDDGAAVAMGLALLDADDLSHPRLEVVFTSDEETGMFGAEGLDVAPLQGRMLLNLDSEDEGVFTVSCAGGARSNLDFTVQTQKNNWPCFRLAVSGLKGGHSGVSIHTGKANANRLLGRTMQALANQTPLRLVRGVGGFKDNVITPAAEAVLAVEDAAAARTICAEMETVLRREYAAAEPELAVTLEAVPAEALALTAADTQKVIDLLTLLPYGVEAMSMDIPGLVQTSANLGIFSLEGERLHASVSVRSSMASQKTMMLERIAALCRLLGGQNTVTGDYPAWEYQRSSRLREICCEAYRQQYGREPKVEAIHAGLECGLFAGKLPGLDAVSLGATMANIHSSRETMFVGSMQRTWKLVTDILARLH